MPEARRVLLVGGTGFLGGHVARAFLARGHAVTALSRGSRPPSAGCEPLIADRRDPVSLAAALDQRRWDFTVDFTAFDAADIELLLTRPHSALGRYTMISTGQVYLVTTLEASRPWREEDSEAPLAPEPAADTYAHANWTYGTGKRRAESALLRLRAIHGVRALILRLPILQGEGDSSLRLWAWIERMLDGGPLLLPDGGARVTRHLWAADAARLLVNLAEGSPPREPVYNLAQPDLVTARELIDRVARILGVRPAMIDAPWEELLARGLEPDFAPYTGRWGSVLDPARAIGELGFVPTPLDDYLPKVVRWHLEHRPAGSYRSYAGRAREQAIAESLDGVRATKEPAQAPAPGGRSPHSA